MELCSGAGWPESNFGKRDREQDYARDDAEEGDDGHRSARANRWPACHGAGGVQVPTKILIRNLSYSRLQIDHLNSCPYVAGAHQIIEGSPAKNVLRGTLGTQSATLCRDWRLLTTEEDRVSLQKMMEIGTMIQTKFPYQRKKHRIHIGVKICKEARALMEIKTHTD